MIWNPQGALRKPEIDGNLFIDEGFEDLKPGDIVTVDVEEAGDYDLWGRLVSA